MFLPDLVQHFVEPLETVRVPYMIVGSVASIAYGEVRTTRDVDLVLMLNARTVELLTAAFPLEYYYCPPPEILRIEASRERRGHFNLVHHESGFVADCHLLSPENTLDRWGMQHRRRTELGGRLVWLAPPECVIVSKLEYYREGGSAKHRRDIGAMLAVTRWTTVCWPRRSRAAASKRNGKHASRRPWTCRRRAFDPSRAAREGSHPYANHARPRQAPRGAGAFA